LYNGNTYYLERVAKLEDALGDVPKQLQLDLMGDGEIDADWALLIRDVLAQRSPDTKLITNARSCLKNGSALVWLLGDSRLIRGDAKVFFRRADLVEDADIGLEKVWNECSMKYIDSYSEADPEEASQAQVLHYINEFLPVRELAGRMIDVRTLRQFGLVENEKLDRFLATAFGQPAAADAESPGKSMENKSKVQVATSVQK
jgi:hypothetical protein